MPTYNDYPQSAVRAAKKALKHKEENGSSCGTRVGWFRANQIANKEGLDLSEIKRTFSFLSRAAVYNQNKYFDDDGNEICGSIMYDAWGGETMKGWAERKINEITEEKNSDIAMEQRSINFELRAKPESRTIYGTATVFNNAYDMGWYDEEMDKDVLKDTDLSDVVALFNHDQNAVLARTKSGTLKLKITDDAMEYEFDAPNTSLGNDLIEMVRRGDVYQSSFAFTVEKESWQEQSGMKPKRLIRSIKKVYDVSPVTYPANPDTMVAKRSYEYTKNIDDELDNLNQEINKQIIIENEIRRNALHLNQLKTL